MGSLCTTGPVTLVYTLGASHTSSSTSTSFSLPLMKVHSNSSEETFTMLDSGSWSPVASELPPLIKSSGLPLERQWYLHKQIRSYCREGTEDLTCPKPSLDTTTNTTTNKTGGAPAPPAKRRKCGKCGEIGHTRRSCKED